MTMIIPAKICAQIKYPKSTLVLSGVAAIVGIFKAEKAEK